ncbi:MAG: phage protease [Gallionella sp.]
MSQAQSQSAKFAALSYALVSDAQGVTTEAHLLPAGSFRSDDIRPVDCAAWLLDAEIAARVIAVAATKRNELLIDYEHQSLRAADNGQKVVAAGWIPNTLEFRDGKGLFATNIAWTADAKRMIAAKEYRYISAVFYYDGETGEVLELVSVALTNTPAIDGLDALTQAALSRGALTIFSTTGDADMATDKEAIAALTADRDAATTKLAALTAENTTIKTSLAALTTENTELKSRVAAIEAEKLQAALTAEKTKCADMIVAAMTVDKTLPPAQEAFAKTLSLASLTEFLQSLKPLAMLSKQAEAKAGVGEHGLSAEQLAMCTQMRVSPEEFVKAHPRT